jgi:uncharacterized protein YcfJ
MDYFSIFFDYGMIRAAKQIRGCMKLKKYKANTGWLLMALTMTLALSNAQPSQAGSAEIEDIYKEVTIKTPYYMDTCQNQKANTQVLDGLGSALKGDGSALVGGIIGGMVGNQIGKGTGQKLATGVGVVIGSNIGKTITTEPRKVCAKDIRYTETTEQRYSHSTIKFVSRGQEYLIEFQRR